MQRASADGGSRVVLACFELRGRSCALDVAQIREVVRWRAPTPLPGAPPLIDGVIELRGAMVPVVDLGRALGGGSLEPDAQTRILLVEADELVVGFAVDAAHSVRAVDAALLSDLPALASQTGYEMARALVRRDEGEPMVLLSVEHCLEAVYRSVLGRREEAA